MIRVSLDGEFDAAVSADLIELQDGLVGNDFKVSRTTIAAPGVKEPVTVGLSIASLTVASVSALINVINFWKAQRKTGYRIHFETAEADEELGADATAALTKALTDKRLTGIRIEKI